MIKLTEDQKKKLAGVAAVVAGVIGGLYYLVVSAQQATLADLTQKSAAAADKATKAEREVKNMQDVEEALRAREQRLASVEATMASGDLYVWSVALVNSFLAQHKGISMLKPPTRPTETDVKLLPGFPYKEAVFTVEGSAHYEDLGRFIADFENEFPFMRVHNIEAVPIALSQPDTERGSEKLGFKMDIVALIKPNTVSAR